MRAALCSLNPPSTQEVFVSSIPGISPITPDIEEIRHREEKRDLVADEQADDPAMDDEIEKARRSSEGDTKGRLPDPA